MKKIVFLALFSFLIAFSSQAQSYDTGVGIRYGWGKGLTVKHFLGEQVAVEGILNSQWKGFNLTGLVEFHKPIANADNLNWFYGGGAHIGWWEKEKTDRADGQVIGLVGIVGAELNLGFIPISLTIDWKPTLNLIGESGFWGDGGALSIRYTF